jgi:large subunit ribosomal protein L18
MANVAQKRSARKKRHQRVRKTVIGTTERPRLNVYRSLDHIYAQVIDDSKGVTLVSASTIDRSVRESLEGKNKVQQAELVGKTVAQRALDAGITKVVFDRGGFQYHGRVRVLADASRKMGLDF